MGDQYETPLFVALSRVHPTDADKSFLFASFVVYRIAVQPVHQASVQCPRCGQMLVVPTGNLHATVQCPRCTFVHAVGYLLPPSTPIAAVPVAMRESTPSYAALPPASHHAVVPYTPPIPPAGYSPSMTPTPPPGSYAPNLTPMPGSVTPLPPSSRAAQAAGRMASQVAIAGVRGTQQIGTLGEKFLALADDFDASLYGKRAIAATMGAFVTVLMTVIDAHYYPHAPFLTTISTGLFSFFLFLLVVARIGSFRDDEGNWSFDIVADRMRGAGKSFGEGFSAFWEMKGGQRIATIGKTLFGISLIGLALRNLVVLFVIIAEELFEASIGTAKSLDESMMNAGIYAILAGLGLWLWGWHSNRSSGKALQLVPDEAGRERLVSAAKEMPLIIDCADKAKASELAARTKDPVLREVLKALVSWQPRGAESEADYQASLHRKLRRELPGANPERERPIGARATGNRGRADLVVSDSVLIEMKKGLTTSSAQRALGQIQMYLSAWNRGPVMLVVCEVDPAMAQQFLVKEIENLRKRQQPVMMVFAGKR